MSVSSKLDYAKLSVSNLFFSNIIEENLLDKLTNVCLFV